MRGIPLIFGAKPTNGLKGPKVPIHHGKWNVQGNHKNSRIVIILDIPPYELQRHELNSELLVVETKGSGCIFAEILSGGDEKSLDIFIERIL